MGTFHARRLLRAAPGQVAVVDRDPGCLAFRTLPVERLVGDWSERLGAWLPGSGPDDQVVPAPWSPHLLWGWLRDATGAEPCTPPTGWGLPFEVAGEPGVRFLSAAAWTCPATCVEPAHCPVLHAPRDWDLASIIEARAAALGWMPAVLRSYHHAQGIAAVPAAAILAARQALAGAPRGARFLVATASHCHAAIGGLRARRSG